MPLNYIKIDGFKNIIDTTIELSKITSLLSVNSYGKSNVLTAIDFGFNFITEAPRDKQKMMGFNRGIPLVLSNLYKDFSFEFNLTLKNNGKTYDIIYGYSFQWNLSKKKGKIISEYLKIKEQNESHKHTLFIDRDHDKVLYKTSFTGRCDKDISIENNELVLNKITAYDNLFYIDIIKYLNNIDRKSVV